jgi:hypothetical protein
MNPMFEARDALLVSADMLKALPILLCISQARRSSSPPALERLQFVRRDDVICTSAVSCPFNNKSMKYHRSISSNLSPAEISACGLQKKQAIMPGLVKKLFM